jgi:predicted site-specific integrase-resolvase
MRKGDSWLTLGAAAREVGVDEATVWRWVNAGSFKDSDVRRQGARGWWRIKRSAIHEYVGLDMPTGQK